MIVKGTRFTPQQTGILREKLGIASPSDYGERVTETQYQATARRLRRLYREAAGDLRLKAESWATAHKLRVEKYRAQVERGEITEADYKAWMKGQLFQEKAWAQRRESMAEAMADVDAQAMRIVNDGKIGVFAENANYMGYQMEQGGGADYGFGLYDDRAVARIIAENPRMLPMPKVQPEKTVAYYNERIQNAVMQGIIQGEDLDGIAFRVGMETGETGLNAMRRNARTAYTAAQNAGRQAGMRQAQQLGAEVQKRWMCTLDGHTRDAHRQLDGQTVPQDQPFESILGPIMYPGDPSADSKNVWGCRCTMITVYPRYPAAIDRRDEEGEIVSDMTYAEWARYKARKAAAAAEEVEA